LEWNSAVKFYSIFGIQNITWSKVPMFFDLLIWYFTVRCIVSKHSLYSRMECKSYSIVRWINCWQDEKLFQLVQLVIFLKYISNQPVARCQD
jgi:hypothetical protein